MSKGHRVAREGISAGPMRASAIAVWFAILDATRSELIVVPARRHARQGGTPGKAAAFLGYTVFHFAIFCVIGYVFSYVGNSAEKVPSARILGTLRGIRRNHVAAGLSRQPVRVWGDGGIYVKTTLGAAGESRSAKDREGDLIRGAKSERREE